MKLGIGIDTGGTYTDGVIYDFDNRKILGSAKALTTKENLVIGIRNALDGLPKELISQTDIVALSTTLATNACIENKGGRAKQLFIGMYKQVVIDAAKNQSLPNVEEIYFLDGKCDINGKILEEPDWNQFIENSKEWLKDADSVGVVGIYAMTNNAVWEKKAKSIIEGKYNIPTVCGHELFADLNSIKRGSSTLLNARLLPIINEFLQAITISLESRGIKAPVVIVRSDGSLMSESFTMSRPVETLLCGPAASVLGGVELTKELDSLIIDMGGTTTDIAIVQNGVPVKAKDGINIGNWHTFVKGLYVDTFGLGGDSAVRFDSEYKLMIDKTRVIPLSVIADKYPSVIDKLRYLNLSKGKYSRCEHEFFYLIKDISDSDNYTEEEISFCKAIKNEPLIYSEAAEAIGKSVYSLDVSRLENEGVVQRCGLTPTDIMHIKGDFGRYNVEAALLGAEFIAAAIGVETDDLPNIVYDIVKKTLYCNIVRLLLEYKYPEYRKNGIGVEIENLIAHSWEEKSLNGSYAPKDSKEFLNFEFSTRAVLVGIGAPIHIFLPDVAKALGTKSVIPENAGVANALGALVGNVSLKHSVAVKPQYSTAGIEGYIVFGSTKNYKVESEEEAVEIAKEEAITEAKAEAINRGAKGDITISTEVLLNKAQDSCNVNVLLEISVVATAVGRITL